MTIPGGSKSSIAGRTARIPLVALLLVPAPVAPAVIVVDDVCSLVDAITAANTDTATGGCPAGAGADELELTADVLLIDVDNDADGPNGLPSITSEITIRGAGGVERVVARDATPGIPAFRIFHVATTGALGLEGLVVRNGLGVPDGGAIRTAGSLTLVDSSLSGNSADDLGGAIHHERGTVALTGSSMSGNTAELGGALYSDRGRATLVDSTVSDNYATFGAGAIVNYFDVLVIDSTISNNSGGSQGGAIDNLGLMILTNTTVSGNSTDSVGGAIYNFSQLYVTNSTFSGNSALRGGGAIYNSSVMTVVNSTFSGNSARGGTRGAIYTSSFGPTTLLSSLLGNSVGGNCSGQPIDDGGNNLADDDTCGTIPDTLTGLDPILTDNGGPTPTHALLAGSNAIDLAGQCGLETDQRGFPRDALCDSGAFEFGASLLALSISGTCPGEVTITLANAPENRAARLWAGPSEGSSVVPSGPCQGTPLDLAFARVWRTVRADANGEASVTGTFPQSWCRRVLQALDRTCATSNTVGFP